MGNLRNVFVNVKIIKSITENVENYRRQKIIGEGRMAHVLVTQRQVSLSQRPRHVCWVK